jgi:ribulose-phosphate 3-epimerase
MCADLLNMERDIRILEQGHVDYLHIDIMDASFVPNLTFGPDIVKMLRGITETPFDIHLLMNNPNVIIKSLDFREGDIVTIHGECRDNILEDIAFIKHKRAKFGMALNPNTRIRRVHEYLPYIDVVLLMLIVPGFAGSTMIHGMMNKVEETKRYLLKHNCDHIEIAVDGSVSVEKAKQMSESGASIFVGGTTAIFRKDKSLEESVREFYTRMQE